MHRAVKNKYGECEYKTGHYAVMDNASTACSQTLHNCQLLWERKLIVSFYRGDSRDTVLKLFSYTRSLSYEVIILIVVDYCLLRK